MEKISGCIVLGMIVIAVLLLAALPVSGGVALRDIGVYYDCETYDGVLEIENYGNENAIVAVEVCIDGKRIVSEDIVLNVKYFKGVRIRTYECIYFEVPTEEGYHEGTAAVSSGDITIIRPFIYKAYGYIEEEEEEVEEEEITEEDWLECP
jgi:hypothetical protein